jgi:hypothetical protein
MVTAVALRSGGNIGKLIPKILGSLTCLIKVDFDKIIIRELRRQGTTYQNR